jgi:signal transduction histidine kinase/CheY-like chemotaxis protein
MTDLAFIKRVVDELPLGVWVARAPGGEEVYANARFADIMGIELVGDLSAGEYSEPYGIHTREGEPYPEDRLPFVRALVANGPVEVDDLVIHRRDGQRVFIRAHARPIPRDDGSPEFIVIAFHDISREVRAQQAQAESEARAPAAARMESVGRLAGGVAHDFNNLLSVIRTTAFLLADEERPERRAEDLEIIREVTERGVSLTRSLLSFAGRDNGDRQPLRVGALVHAMSPMFDRAMDERIEVRYELDDARDVIADRAGIEQLLMNLVLNARDAMPDGGDLSIVTYDRGEATFIEVRDTGGGVDDAVIERVFEPYVSTKPEAEHGTAGLGLATCYGVAKGHDGEITLENHGAGAVARVRLPSVAGAARPAEPNPEPAQEKGAKHGVVLIADDVEYVRIVTARALERLGFSVRSAADGAEAVEIFRNDHDRIDAVLLDVRMPRLDGRGAFAQLREIDPSVPIIFLTGFTVDEERDELLKLGAEGFLPKPIDPQRLEAEILRVTRSD